MPVIRPLRAIGFSLLSGLGFSLMHVCVRITAERLHPIEVAFFRNLFGLLVLLPFFLRHGVGVVRTERIGLHLLRGGLQVGAMLMFFTALTLSPLAQVSALSFTAPLFATLGAVVLLGERLRLPRVVALVTGFAGALLILRPGAVPLELGSLLVLASSTGWALAMLTIKRLTATESSLTLTAWGGLVLTPLSLIPAAFVWQWPNGRELLWLMFLGLLGTTSQFLMAEAFRFADASVVLAVDFTRLLWASLLGYLLFAEIPGAWTLIGGAVIFASTTYISYREARVQRAAMPVAGSAPT